MHATAPAQTRGAIPNATARRTMTLGERNEKWRIMADRLRWPASAIGVLCGVSQSTVEKGLKDARAKAEASNSTDETSHEGLSAADRSYLARRYHSVDDEDIRDFLGRNNCRQRSRP